MLNKTVLLAFFISWISLSQKSDFDGLIERAQYLFGIYYPLDSAYSEEVYSIYDFELHDEDVNALKKELRHRINEREIPEDSIYRWELIGFLQERLVDQLDQIVRHPDFYQHDVWEKIGAEDLGLVMSKDKRLVNFSFDAKTGGTYQARISRFYLIKSEKEIIDITSEDFARTDGYTHIYRLDTEEGVKYVLTGAVRGCLLCFETFVQLINENLIEEFHHAVVTREFNEGVSYDPVTNSIRVAYQTNDLTPSCSCENAETPIELERKTPCNCVYIFDGKNFALTSEHQEEVK